MKVILHLTQKHRQPLTNMSNKLCYYICLVTKNGKTEEYGYGLSYKEVMEAVEEHYTNGADAVYSLAVILVPCNDTPWVPVVSALS